MHENELADILEDWLKERGFVRTFDYTHLAIFSKSSDIKVLVPPNYWGTISVERRVKLNHNLHPGTVSHDVFRNKFLKSDPNDPGFLNELDHLIKEACDIYETQPDKLI